KPVLCLLELQGELQPLCIERRFVKIEQALNEKRVVVCETIYTPAFSITSCQRLLRFVPKLRLDKIGGAGRRFKITGVAKHLRAACERRDHEAVPCGDNLVVQMRARPFLAQRKQCRAAFVERITNS